MIQLRQCAKALAAILAAAMASMAMADPPAGQGQSAKTLFSARVEALREAAAKDAAAFAGFLSVSYQTDGEAVRKAWADIAAEFPAAQLRDFFAGATVLVGPVSRQNGKELWAGVLALCNPWWDAILVMRLGDDLRIDRMAFLGGEAFRAETDAAASAVSPSGEPLSLALMRVQSKTAARFRELYPDGGDDRTARIPPRGISRDLTAVRERAALRQRLLGAFIGDGAAGGNAGMVAVAAKMRDGLRKADAAGLKRLFADPVRAAYCDNFAQFPSGIREGFGLYGYYPAEKGTLFAFLNPSMPRIYATVTFPKNRENDPSAGAVVFEWFDLDQADEVVEKLKPVCNCHK